MRGAYVIAIADFEHKQIHGLVGRVIYRSGDTVSVEFRNDIGGHEGLAGDGRQGHCWDIPRRYLMEIPEELYNKKPSYKIKKFDPGSELSQLDAMPDGVTYEQAAASLNSGDALELKIEELAKS